MQTNERGQATAVVLGIAALVVVTIVGIGIYAYMNPSFGLNERDRDNRPGNSFYDTSATSTLTVGTSTPATSTIAMVPSGGTSSGSSSSGSTAAKPKPTATRTQTASAYRSVYGSYPYGITVPSGYAVAATASGVYGGVQPTASYAFYQNGVYAFTINVFSKEQWNNIRIQETINAKEGTGPQYLGEGRYIGESMTWIYSAVGGVYQPSGVGYTPTYYTDSYYSPYAY